MVTRITRTFAATLIAALLSVVLVAPQAHAAEVTTWEQLRDALASGGTVTVGADISGGGVTVSRDVAATLDLAGHTVNLVGGPAVDLTGTAQLTVVDSVGGGLLDARLDVDQSSIHAAVIGTNVSSRASGYSHAGSLTIDGAVVKAISARVTGVIPSTGAAVGGGISKDGGEETVISGELIADVSGGLFAAGIGGGADGDGGTLTVHGGTVTALSSSSGAGIGGGENGHGGPVSITGGVVNATGNAYGAGIGGGNGGQGGTVSISGGVVNATGGTWGAGIGGGGNSQGGTVSISGGLVNATGGTWGAGIGGGGTGDGGDLTVSGGEIHVTGGGGAAAAIGGGDRLSSSAQDGNGGTFTMTGGHLTATGSIRGVAIGGGSHGAGGLVTFSGGRLEAIGGTSANAIGPGLQAVSDISAGIVEVAGSLHPGSATVIHGPVPATLKNVPGGGAVRVTNTINPEDTRAGTTVIEAGFTVAHDANGGTPALNTQWVLPGNTASAPKAPTRTGHTFDGWLLNGKPFNFNTTVTDNLTLTAQWTRDTPAGPGPKPVTPVNLVDVSSNPNSPHYTQFYRQIQWLASTGITKGWNIGGGKYEFRPKEEISREAMAAFMYRYAGSPAVTLPAKSPFTDVTPSNTNFYREIIWMNQQGISTGWNMGGGKKEFRPKDAITRDAMAAFMYRFAGKPATTPPATSPFTDVPRTSQFYKEVTWLASTGISTGWNMGGGKYEYRPYDNISREAMAAFLFRFNRL